MSKMTDPYISERRIMIYNKPFNDVKIIYTLYILVRRKIFPLYIFLAGYNRYINVFLYYIVRKKLTEFLFKFI